LSTAFKLNNCLSLFDFKAAFFNFEFMKKIIILIFCFLNLCSSWGQKEDYIWMIGRGSTNFPLYTTSKIDFHTYPPTMEIVLQDFDFDVVAAIGSTKNGNLQCYSNGVDIQNHQHEIIENGMELIDYTLEPAGLAIVQGNLILPIPELYNHYFFVTSQYLRIPYQGAWAGSVNPILTSTIDMNANNGLGTVIERNNILNTDTLSPGQIVATRHANGRDWWILASKTRTNLYYRYLLSPNGIAEYPIQEVGMPMNDDLGQAVFSPDGKQYARFNEDFFTQQSHIDLYDFDRCSGLLSNHKRYSLDITVPGGIAFSPNSRYLYISLWEEIWQYDLQAPDIFASGVLVAEYDGFLGDNQGLQYHNRFFMMQLAPDGRIYINIPNTNSQYLHVIQYPDRGGLDCEVRQHFIQLPAFNAFTLPNLPWYRLGPEDAADCDTLGLDNLPMAHFRFDPDPNDSLNVVFTDLSAYQPEQWTWEFGDGSGVSTNKNNDYRYADNGTYEVCLEVSNTYGSDRTCQMVDLGKLTSTIELVAPTISLYPNPFTEQFWIDWPDFSSAAEVRIVDALGRMIVSEPIRSSNHQLNTSHWASRIYFYQIIKNGKVVSSGKVVKQ